MLRDEEGENGTFGLFAQWQSKQALLKAKESVPTIRSRKYEDPQLKMSFVCEENKNSFFIYKDRF